MIENNSEGNWATMRLYLLNDNIKHFSFDFWNTIAFSNPAFKQKRAEYLLNFFCTDISLNNITDAFKKIGRDYNIQQESGGSIIKPDDLLKLVFNELNLSVSQKDFEEIKSNIDLLFIQNPPLIDNQFFNILETIFKSKKTCSITSNTAFISGKIIQTVLENNRILNNFSFFLFSDEIGYAKPNPKIYELLFSRAKSKESDLKKSHIIHLGDNINADYQGSKDFGFIPYLLK
jgi:putative hydrolase of the HAD superfamily